MFKPINYTKEFQKIRKDSDNPLYCINSNTIYNFVYNHSYNRIIYTTSDHYENNLKIETTLNNNIIATMLMFNQVDNEFYIDSSLLSELYKKLKNIHVVNDENDFMAYIRTLSQTILHKKPQKAFFSSGAKKSPPKMYIQNDPKNTSLEKDSDSKNRLTTKKTLPYFQSFVCKPISKKMKKKIYTIFSSEIAAQIIKFYGTTMTLRFTNNVAKEKNILLLIDN